VGPQTTSAATLRELQDQLKKAEEELARFQEMQQKEKQKADTYSVDIKKTQQQIDSVRNSIQSLEGNIQSKEATISSTSKDIEDKSNKLNQFNQELNNSLAQLYELTNLSSVEVMADNKNISHYVDRTEYLQALQDRIISNIEQMSQIKADLEKTRAKLEDEKNTLARLKGEQEAKNAQLASEQKQKYTLLNSAKANEAKYQELVQKLANEKDSISKEIYELRKKMSKQSREVYVGGTSGYPWSAINSADPWLFLTRQCTSYAAWKWNVVYKRPWDNTRPGQGSAWNWPALARDQGYRVVSTPQAGAIVSWDRGPAMPYGHVAIVESVNSDGTINVSEYNWNPAYGYSERKNVNPSDYGTARFIVP
jgi:peptidoglycan DL-endopeptidase CwlO